MNRQKFMTQLGHAIRLVRISRGETLYSMCVKLGYYHESGFSKLERGEVHSIEILKLVDICNVLKVSPYFLCKLAGFDLLSHPDSISTFNQFYTSLLKYPDEEVHRLLSLLPPSVNNDLDN